LESNFLLSSNASGKVPRHLSNESGFSSSVIDDENRTTKKTIKAAIQDIEEKSANLFARIEKIATAMEAKIGESKDSSSAETPVRNAEHSIIHGIMDEIQKLRGHERILETPVTNTSHKTINGILNEIKELHDHEQRLNSEVSYTPMTKEALVDGIKKRKVELSDMAKTLFPAGPKVD
jgi:hypothetical protein